jgi:hypothetical protein
MLQVINAETGTHIMFSMSIPAILDKGISLDFSLKNKRLL